jgi:hypothetical protein
MTTSNKIVPSDSGLKKESGDTQIEYANSLKLADEKGDYSGATAKTDAREIALVRKLDMRIMPIMWAMYFLNYVSKRLIHLQYSCLMRGFKIDRNAIANARLNNLEEDLGLVGTQYNTCISILFVGYEEFAQYCTNYAS